jgi:hypothetical protein
MARPPDAQIGDEMSEASGTPDPTPPVPVAGSAAPAVSAAAPVATVPAYARAPAAPAKRPVVMWDLVLTIVLLVVMIGLALLGSFLSFFLAFASDSCGSGITCDYDRMATGMLVAMIGPLAVGLLALIAAVVVLVLRRLAFWIPIVGIVLVVGVFVGGAALTISGVPGSSP